LGSPNPLLGRANRPIERRLGRAALLKQTPPDIHSRPVDVLAYPQVSSRFLRAPVGYQHFGREPLRLGVCAEAVDVVSATYEENGPEPKPVTSQHRRF
jgi:hypothetical protein